MSYRFRPAASRRWPALGVALAAATAACCAFTADGAPGPARTTAAATAVAAPDTFARPSSAPSQGGAGAGQAPSDGAPTAPASAAGAAAGAPPSAATGGAPSHRSFPTASPAPRTFSPRPSPTVAPTVTSFVRASGTHLVLGGRTWDFTGYDDYRLASQAPGYQCGGPLTLSDVDSSLTEIQSVSGANVVRVWFMQSYGGPGNWGQFDRVLTAAAEHGMKVIPVLTDQWAACEPWPAGQTKYRTLSWYQGGYRSPDYGYSLSYRAFATAMAAHYAQNPTIAFWQLVNEAEDMTAWGGSCDEPAAVSALRSFADDVTGAMKSVDANHMVSLGTIGTGQCGASSNDDYTYIHAGRVDLCEYHDYFGPGAVPGDQWHGIGVRINDCHSLNKPIFAGEVGLQASIQPDGSTGSVVTAASLQLRAGYFQQKLAGQFAAGVVGFLIWQYATGARTDGYEVQPGDPTEGVMHAFSANLPRG